MPFLGPRKTFCTTEGCVNYTTWGFHCDRCHELRKQHETSHRLEGHDETKIKMCPRCEKRKP